VTGSEKSRPFWRQPEWVITLVTVVTSIAALALGAYTALLQRRHDSASVWPHLEFGIIFAQQTSGMQVSNSGVGPAIVQSVAVSVDGHLVRSWPEVFKLVLDSSTTRYSSSSVSDRVIRAGETVNWFQLPTDILPHDIQARMARVAIEVCYASVYDEHWTVADAHAGQHTVWRNVKRCPNPGRSDF
jgi:hypothetical protein